MVWKFLSEQKLTARNVRSELLRLRGLDVQTFADEGTDGIHSPWQMAEMRKAVEVIAQYIESGKKILIHGDYDVDGVCATAILWDFLYRELKADVLPYIPDRFNEGYGLTENSIAAMRELGAELVITVDCGIRDQELIAANSDLDFVVTDHHALPVDDAGEPAPPQAARAVVHPRHPAAQYPYPEICGTMVSWKLAWALAEHFGLEFDKNKYIDLVALATTCDVMPLLDENRAVVKAGIEQMKQTRNAGLAALLEQAGIKQESIETYHFGFVIGPRINAAGRIDSAMTALKLLTTQSTESARQLAAKLQALNAKRQQMSIDLFSQAQEQLVDSQDSFVHIVSGMDWPEGILGLVAGKLSEQLYRPVIALSADSKTQLAVGSARSIPEFNIIEALQKFSGKLTRFGGHAQAAGLTISLDELESFRDELAAFAETELRGRDLEQQIIVDGILDVSELGLDLYAEIVSLSPFGEGLPEPKFVLQNLTISEKRPLGKDGKHVKVFLVNEAGNRVAALGFNKADRLSSLTKGDQVDIVGTLQANTWQGHTSIELKIDDLRAAQ